ncbi:MAG: hypothetical protein A2787_04310 [Omnitrophica WOR_2 bacterium RIFCSPHIGHO2_01_FULL_48_9]|nr:MAG: hypothetical protein A3D10_08640 [Omnitrophica WOR_2 bacterium RIFCSPHIGHO2_02_FULL_48_11]OGX32116.1 MAG: hypothetical protein A2787_04310 [Omnitrophica WOR_2 bacterium RIFCSPHIGHO2_01_FULL_48_9]
MNNVITYPFTESFLDNLIDYIEENFVKKGKDLSRVAVVFGGKRPTLFLKRELAKRLGKGFYSPKFFSIDEFITYTLNKKESFQPGQDMDSCYLLYKLAREHTPQILKGRETFAQFLPWTREILSFIDQLDLENIADKTLENIEANAEIGYAVPADINRLLENIVVLRRAYHRALHEQKIFSRGLQYLRAGQVVAEAEFAEFEQILFCNFFYFNRSEEAVVKNLYERNKATLIFQGDERRWPVFKRISRNFGAAIEEGKEPLTPQFDLKLYAGFDTHSQVGLVREILQKIKKQAPQELSQTVIVVPDPDHIIPLLSEVTQVAQDFNISMGYPLKRSSLYTLFEFIFQSQASRKSVQSADGLDEISPNNRNSGRKHRYYAKDYLKTISHPFIKNLKLSSDPTVTRILVHKIEEILTGKVKTSLSGSLFFELEDVESLDELYMLTQEMLDRLGLKAERAELLAIVENIHALCFEEWERVSTFKDLGNILERFLDILTHKSFMHNYPLNLNIATKMYEIKDEFVQAAFNEEKFPQEDLFRIFDSKVSREIVAFMGSPLKGLQILGLFETRSLNFTNVIMLDVNEGVLPRLQIYEPLIPREVMISLNLDRLELEEEIQRYQFMRLISSARNVHLVYQESKEKEKSRFVEELIWERQKKLGKVEAIAVTRANFAVKVAPQKLAVKKTPQMVAALRRHTFSASSVNKYLENPMEFYYNYVLGLREEDDLLDEPEARQVGTFIHELLEHCYRPFLNKKPEVNAKFREYFSRAFEKKFADTFERTMKSDSFLLKSVLADRLKRFLDNEEFNEERQVEKILYLEHRFEETIELSCGPIRFNYVVDRVDQLPDGTVMVVDYKTGSIDQMPRSLEQVAALKLSRESIRDTVKSFQLPLYFHYLDKQFPKQPINAALYNLRALEIKPFLNPQLLQKRQEVNGVFLRALGFVVEEILDQEIPFIEDPQH